MGVARGFTIFPRYKHLSEVVNKTVNVRKLGHLKGVPNAIDRMFAGKKKNVKF